MHNYTPLPRKNQGWLEDYLSLHKLDYLRPANQPKLLSKEVKPKISLEKQAWQKKHFGPEGYAYQSPLNYIEKNTTEAQRKVLCVVIMVCGKNRHAYASQAYIADIATVSLAYCNKALKHLEGLGLISKFYRHRTTCNYRVAEYFKIEHIRSELSHILPGLRYMWTYLQSPISSLNGLPKLSLSRYVIPLGKRTIGTYKYNSYPPSPRMRTGHSGSGIELRIIPASDNSHKPYKTLRALTKWDAKHMQDNAPNPISPLIRSLNELNLSRSGQIKLSAFPDNVIDYAKDKLGYAKNVKDPFNWFLSVCTDYCKSNDIKPDWPWVYELSKKYNVDLNTSPIIVKRIPPKYRDRLDARPVVREREKEKKTFISKDYPVSPMENGVDPEKFDLFKKTATPTNKPVNPRLRINGEIPYTDTSPERGYAIPKAYTMKQKVELDLDIEIYKLEEYAKTPAAQMFGYDALLSRIANLKKVMEQRGPIITMTKC